MPDSKLSEIQEKLLQFIVSQLATAEFEKWVYDTPELEVLFGSDLYLEVISLDYRNERAVRFLKGSLRRYYTNYFPNCECVVCRNAMEISIPHNLEKNFDYLRKQTPWLDLARCVHCKTHWYMGYDTYNGSLHMHRLTNEEAERILNTDEWPHVFDDNPHLWPSEGWLKAFGYKSLEDWAFKNNRKENTDNNL
jgi:hypothetical protein